MHKPIILMYLIVLLGNYGEKYATTRHNVAWIIGDEIFSPNEYHWKYSKYADADYVELSYGNESLVVVKPRTLMNRSGQSVNFFKKEYDIKNKHIIVVHDDIALDHGEVKLSFNRGSGNHNGVASVFNHINGKDCTRVRIGIGHPDPVPMRDYVLMKMSPKEIELLEFETATKSKNIFKAVIRDGYQQAMNTYN